MPRIPQRPRREPEPPVPCQTCGCSIDRYWRLCPYCEQWQAPEDVFPRQAPPAHVKRKVIERQLIEAFPDWHERALDAMTPSEQMWWLHRWNPTDHLRIVTYLACTCGRRLEKNGRCPECSAGKRWTQAEITNRLRDMGAPDG